MCFVWKKSLSATVQIANIFRVSILESDTYLLIVSALCIFFAYSFSGVFFASHLSLTEIFLYFCKMFTVCLEKIANSSFKEKGFLLPQAYNYNKYFTLLWSQTQLPWMVPWLSSNLIPKSNSFSILSRRMTYSIYW